MILEQYLIKSRKKVNNMEQIITSLLETDAYKLSMGQAIYHQFSDYKTTWSFKCRNKDVHFTPEMVEEIRRQIKLYCGLRFTEDELTYIDNIKWMKGSYVDFLRLWQPRYEDFEITTDSDCGLSIIYTVGDFVLTEEFGDEFTTKEKPWMQSRFTAMLPIKFDVVKNGE